MSFGNGTAGGNYAVGATRMSTAWKAHERRTAAALGGKRAGPTGKEGADVLHPLWAIECKERKELPIWLQDAMMQARRAAIRGQVPIVVLHQLGSHGSEDLVVMRRADFQALHGLLKEGSRND